MMESTMQAWTVGAKKKKTISSVIDGSTEEIKLALIIQRDCK